MIFELRQPADLMIAKRRWRRDAWGIFEIHEVFWFYKLLVDKSVWVAGWGIDLDFLALVLGLQGLDGLALLGVLNAAGWDGLGLLDWLRDTVAQLVAVGLNLDDNLNLLIFANLVGL